MQRTDSDSSSTTSYLLEHSHGTCELWIKQTDTEQIRFFEPVRLERLSGRGTILLQAEMVAEAIALEEWMADHYEVFRDGRTSQE